MSGAARLAGILADKPERQRPVQALSDDANPVDEQAKREIDWQKDALPRRDQPSHGVADERRKVILDPMAIDQTPEPVREAAHEQPENLDLRSMELTAEKKQELLRLFPEARTEGGKIDFDRLRLALGDTVDTGRERYGMTWPGKAECFRTIQTPSLGTLLPSRDESVEWDTTENLIIEGDNLEVLKLLQKSYLGKVKMIYIDPPYNTGNDFIYPDDYTESLQTYLEYTGQVDTEGRRFGTNTDADGRFHSKWMNMMYPRVYLARNLLREDGVIFVSIDDSEQVNARLLLNDIFGEENFVACLIWQKVYSPRMDDQGISTEHDYVLVYRASDQYVPSRMPFKQNEKQFTGFDAGTGSAYRPRSLRKEGKNSRRADRPNLFFPVQAPDGSDVYPIRADGAEGCWRMARKKFDELTARSLIEWVHSKSGWQPYVKQMYQPDATRPYMTIWKHEEVGHNHAAADELKRLIGESGFPSPKPVGLIRRAVKVANGQVPNDDDDSVDDIIVDFFAGSGTTADALLNLNREDGGNRKFILVQLPELTKRDDFRTIAEITKERVRRVIKKLNDEDAEKLDLHEGQKQDRGFRVFKLAESNFKTWNADAPKEPAKLAEQLELHVEHTRPGREQEDILFEVLMKSGYPLTARVETLSLEGKTVFSVAEGALLVCLERALTIEVIRAIAARKPERVVCLDEGFAGNDQLKANAVQIFKTLHQRSDEGEQSDVTVFRTV